MGKNTKKKTITKKSDKSANIARIEAAENGQATGEPEAVPVDEVAKPSKSKSKGKGPKPGKAPKEKPARKPSLLDHAVEILKKAKEPMTCKEITEAVMKSTDWTTNGKTPHATLYSAVIREIAEKKAESRFKKVDRGMFAASDKAS